MGSNWGTQNKMNPQNSWSSNMFQQPSNQVEQLPGSTIPYSTSNLRHSTSLLLNLGRMVPNDVESTPSSTVVNTRSSCIDTNNRHFTTQPLNMSVSKSEPLPNPMNAYDGMMFQQMLHESQKHSNPYVSSVSGTSLPAAASVTGPMLLLSQLSEPLSAQNELIREDRSLSDRIRLTVVFENKSLSVETSRNSRVYEFKTFLKNFCLPEGCGPIELIFEDHVLSNDTFLYMLPLEESSAIHIVHTSHESLDRFPRFDPTIQALKPTYKVLPDGTIVRHHKTIEVNRYADSLSRAIPSEPTAEKQIHFAEDVSQKVVPSLIRDYFPILRRPEYYMRPSHSEMSMMSEEQVQHVNDFVVGRELIGEVMWFGETDLRKVNLDERVLIEMSIRGKPSVQIYPASLFRKAAPSVGKELNKRAQVTLFNVFPKSARTPEGNKRMEEEIRQRTSQMGAQFVEYDPSLGKWVFIVENFSD